MNGAADHHAPEADESNNGHRTAAAMIEGRPRRPSRFRYRHRLLVGMLVVSVPIMVGLALVSAARSSDSLTDASHASTEALARAVAVRLEDWVSEREDAVAVLADQATHVFDSPEAENLLAGVESGDDDYQVVVLADTRGRVVASSHGVNLDLAESEWYAAVLSGESVVTSPVERDGGIDWVVAQPVFDRAGGVQGAVVAYLSPTVLVELLNPGIEAYTYVALLDANGVLIYDTDMGGVADDVAMLERGALAEAIDNEAVRKATERGGGSARYIETEMDDVIGGTATVGDLGWIVLVEEHTSHVLAPVQDQRVLVRRLVGLGILVAAVAAWLFARFESKRLVAFADSTHVAGLAVNSAASELSSASDELAATTTQQSAAVTEASATTEELARASSAIADTVEDVAGQAAETRSNLEQAEHDIQLSSERMMALASRVNEIGGLLTLINQFADQTGLLALNAAIEAARAGEEGRGFAVVAEEVRRLAESSKSSAGDIEVIIDAVHAETNATVMAMEKGATQMQQGLVLLDRVTNATDHVRLTTQRQRNATAQVVETMEQLTDASRTVAGTAQQIAGAAGNLAQLAGNLETTATAARARY